MILLVIKLHYIIIKTLYFTISVSSLNFFKDNLHEALGTVLIFLVQICLCVFMFC